MKKNCRKIILFYKKDLFSKKGRFDCYVTKFVYFSNQKKEFLFYIDFI